MLLRGVLLVGCLPLACATLSPEQRSAVKAVQIRSIPAENCQNLGEVTGSDSVESASGMRARAVKRGGNTLRIDANGGGTVFYCPDLAAAAPLDE